VTVRCALPPAFAVPAQQRLGDKPYEFGKRTYRVHGCSIAQMFILSQLPGLFSNIRAINRTGPPRQIRNTKETKQEEPAD
jgi:hypothetical protein